MIVLIGLLISSVIPCTLQEGCGQCWYPYINNDTTRVEPSGVKDLTPFTPGVMTISGYTITGSCSSTWHSFLNLKKDNDFLMNIKYYHYSNNNNKLHFLKNNDNSIYYYNYLVAEEGKPFKLQFVVESTERTGIYLNQNEEHKDQDLSNMKKSIHKAFQEVQSIEVFNTQCAVFHYVSVCPMSTKDKLCSAHDSYPKKKLVDIGASTSLKCSIRTIYTDPIKHTIKWSFQNVDHELVYFTSQSPLEIDNLLVSTLELAKFSSKDIGRYTCMLYMISDNSPLDKQVFEVLVVPEIISKVYTSNRSTEHSPQVISRPIFFNLTKNTTLIWNVASWSNMNNLSVEVQLRRGDDISAQKVFRLETTQINATSSEIKQWKYFTFSLATYQDITSLTTTFKMSNQTFRELTYITIEEEIPSDPAESDGHTNGHNLMIFIMIGSVSVIAIVLNNIFCWIKNRKVEKEETLVTFQREDMEEETAFAEVELEEVGDDVEDNKNELYEAFEEGAGAEIPEDDEGECLYAKIDKKRNLPPAGDRASTKAVGLEGIRPDEDDEEQSFYATVDKMRYPKPFNTEANATSSNAQHSSNSTAVAGAEVAKDGPNIYATFGENGGQFANVKPSEDMVLNVDEDEYGTLQRG